jgi:serine/threonine-protein kinase HipA
LSEHPLFGLQLAQAHQQVGSVAAVVSGWKAHFASVGVTQSDIESLAQQIDRPFLQDQRMAFAAFGSY